MPLADESQAESPECCDGAEPRCLLAHYTGIMASTLPVVINRSGGTAAAMGVDLGYLVTRAFARAGRTIALELVDGCDVAFAIARHARAPLVAVGGGDGTLGAAAAAKQIAHDPVRFARIDVIRADQVEARPISLDQKIGQLDAILVGCGSRVDDVGRVFEPFVKRRIPQ